MATLTPGEIEVMQILWEHGELNPTEIQEEFPRSIKNAALRFQLRVLLGKKHVTRRKVGRSYYYRATEARRGALRKMSRKMADFFTQGSVAGLIAELMQSEKLTADEIAELQRIAATKSSKQNTGRKGGDQS